MKLMNQKLRFNMNLQFFADEEGGDDSDGDDSGDDGDDDQDDDQDDDKSKKKSKKSGKTFTQEELDKAIADRLKRERAKEKKAKEKAEADKNKTPEDKKADADKEQSEKVSNLEAKLACFEHDVAKDSVSDVVTLARAYMRDDEDLDFDAAIEKVIKKYPSFVKGSTKKKGDDDDEEEEEETKSKSWGERQKSKSKKTDGVEAAFLKRNPGLKID